MTLHACTSYTKTSPPHYGLLPCVHTLTNRRNWAVIRALAQCNRQGRTKMTLAPGPKAERARNTEALASALFWTMMLLHRPFLSSPPSASPFQNLLSPPLSRV
jgi:hypothetical protein